MNMRKTRFQPKRLVAIFMVLCLTFGLGQIVGAAEYRLGDIPLDPETYRQYLKVWPQEAVKALPPSYDARDDGIVTPVKDQGACSAWTFACVGAFESHLLKEFSFGPVDLSEQQQISCNLSMLGCCGGSMSALQWWEDKGPIYESCFPYGESSTFCPTQRTVPCEDSYGCEQLPYRVTNFHTLDPTPDQFKTSLYNDGPSYWRYDFYNDFSSFWYLGGPGDVYVNSEYSVYGGAHPVLIIGWDDNKIHSAGKGAYLCKNSWGETGPNGDGTFWIAYSGHAHDLRFGMANFNLTIECDYCLEDSYGYEWCLNVIDQDSTGLYLTGKCDTGTIPLKDAMATYLISNRGISMSAWGGATGAIFNYNIHAGSGIWINDYGSYGPVTIRLCTASDEDKVRSVGPLPDAGE